MKKIAFIFAMAATFAACNSTPETNEETTPEEVEVAEVILYDNFGDSTFSTEDAIPSTELIAFMDGRDSVEATVSGTISEVCKKKGCWMSIPVDDGSNMHVTYDYEFLLPLNCDGKEMVMNGYAHYDTIPVSHLKHLAQDAEKSEEEINQITEPKITLAFLATGVKIKK